MKKYTCQSTPSKLLLTMSVGHGDRQALIKMIASLVGYSTVMLIGWWFNPMTLIATMVLAVFVVPGITKSAYGKEYWHLKKDSIGLQKHNGLFASKLIMYDFENLEVNYLPIRTSTTPEAVLKLRLDAKSMTSEVRMPLEDVKTVCKKIADFYSVS